jgi:hypothetical protein
MRPGLFSMLSKLAAEMSFPSGYRKALEEGRKNVTVRIGEEVGKYRVGEVYEGPAGSLRVLSVIPTTVDQLHQHGLPSQSVARVRREGGRPGDAAEIIHFEKLAGLAPSQPHQEFLDNHFTDASTSKWRAFKNKLVSPRFVDAVKQDERADTKLKRYSENNARHMQAKGVPSYQVPSQSTGRSYTVKYHPSIERFSCNCGDWVHKQSTRRKSGECKHVKMVKMELKAQGISKEKQAALRGAAAAALLSGPYAEG